MSGPEGPFRWAEGPFRRADRRSDWLGMSGPEGPFRWAEDPFRRADRRSDWLGMSGPEGPLQRVTWRRDRPKLDSPEGPPPRTAWGPDRQRQVGQGPGLDRLGPDRTEGPLRRTARGLDRTEGPLRRTARGSDRQLGWEPGPVGPPGAEPGPVGPPGAEPGPVGPPGAEPEGRHRASRRPRSWGQEAEHRPPRGLEEEKTQGVSWTWVGVWTGSGAGGTDGREEGAGWAGGEETWLEEVSHSPAAFDKAETPSPSP
ncbi:collagen alpha-1(I) chain-like [Acanthochromis polyacanthus]|uniref:collagen alpha-1(I) chain-like n=1 Tax=Acanthochromis polyacanthus TaxID=80966 RepID=UPI00223492FF|nr:collagen alpha-1(I) chain-like [Acanthochromis polyacanthus]